jgi:hypothetical protein
MSGRAERIFVVLSVLSGFGLLAGCAGQPDATAGGAGATAAATDGRAGVTASGTTPGPGTAAGPATPMSAQALAALSDEFEDAASLTGWQRSDVVEGRPSQWKALDVDTTSPGHLYLEPTTSLWWSDFRAPFLFRPVTGDFVATIRVRASGRTTTTPHREYSLVGLMARAPRTDTAATWTPGRENWVFLTTGTAEPAGTPQFEVKTTVNGRSTLLLSDAATGWVEIRVARLGSTFVMLQRTAVGNWTVHQRYSRPDLPATVQVGICAYTDWDWLKNAVNSGDLTAKAYNAMVYTDGYPDLVARVDWFHLRALPANLAGRDLTADDVADDDLLTALGD